MCSTMGQAVEVDISSADTALTAALREGVEHLTHDQSTALLTQLRALTAKADALSLAVVGKVDAEGTHTYDGALTTSAWVRAFAHQTPAEAARTVRTARTLRTGALPNTAAALAAGAISARHASVIADGVTDAPAGAVALIEAEAVDLASEGDVRATANLMRAFGHALDPDTADQKALRRYERAGVTLSPMLEGGFAITGTADETTGATIIAAINTARPLVKGGTGTAATAQRLGCDTTATFVTLDPHGNVVEAGTQRRFFTTSQRLAIIARDGDACPTPFCDRPAAWSDGHHLIPVDQGGPTTIANGALPCEQHHLQLHEGHWTLQRLPDGRYLMHHPQTGRTLGPEPPRPGHNRPPPE
jgi:uncharacterized protein DUF222/HNH endonuclease